MSMAYQLSPMGTCRDCNAALTLEESHYYEYRCEKCERAWHERITSWRNGGEDRGLDALFGAEAGE